MSTITKEWLKQRITDMEAARDEIPFGLDEDDSNTLAALRIALASLEADAVYFVEIEDGQDINAGRIEGKNRPDLRLLPDGINHLYAAPPAPANAEPVAWLWSHRKHPSEVTLVRPEDDEKAEGAHWSGWSCQALYAELPAPVSVQDDEQCKPHPVMAVKGELGFLDHFERIIDERDYDIEIGRLSSSNGEALMLAALDAFRASMPQVSDSNSQWVACSERMPEPGRWLALYGARVFTHGSKQGQSYEEFCVDQGYLGYDGNFYAINWDRPGMLDDNYNNDLAIATHWMYWELPAAPRG